MAEGPGSIKIRRTRDHAKLPARAKKYDAGYDLFAAESFVLEPWEVKAVSTGIAFDIPPGYAGLVCPRSGMAIRERVTVHNAPGVIDPTYDGEVKVILHNARSYRYEGSRFDKIAQLVIVQTLTPAMELQHTEWETFGYGRGSAGFGSTGR